MPCLWGFHNNSQIFLDVGIIDASTFSLPTTIGAQPTTQPSPVVFRSLVDTGCQRTMISSNVVQQLKLSATGKVPIQGVGPNVTYHNAYLFHVSFVIPIISAGQIVVPGMQIQAMIHVLPNVIQGGELTNISGFDVLLGMDVLSAGSLKIEGNGSYSFSF